MCVVSLSDSMLFAQNSDESIDRLVASLGDADYSTRVQATRQLLVLGSSATQALHQAAAGDDLETALRARGLLRVFEQMYFAGAEVSLRFSKGAVAWDEPLELVVRVKNTTPHVVRVPFAPQSDEQGDDDARQVGAMLDLADFLEVTGPDGKSVDLHVDDIGDDEKVEAAVRLRADEGPTTELRPGGVFEHRCRLFNRGWARYRLFHVGEYTVRLVYQPQWSERELIDAEVGRVESAVAVVRVTAAAPKGVRRYGARTSVHVRQDGDTLVASLTNHDDLPVYINVNVSDRADPPFAALRWYVSVESGRRELVVTGDEPRPFARERILRVGPGRSVELGRLAAARLIDSVVVEAEYANHLSRAWQRTRLDELPAGRAAEALRSRLPARMLVASVRSESAEFNAGR